MVRPDEVGFSRLMPKEDGVIRPICSPPETTEIAEIRFSNFFANRWVAGSNLPGKAALKSLG
ncbi:hypothetical protein T190_25340 [Sinorhizobium meliloti CCBAU 01290]|nr:hypothetical protein T190_25340 [Sinorhizobium meliloti CCBAU 01290]